jgi:ubiquinone/menaquinone biosynthesis C-methylase UbiE
MAVQDSEEILSAPESARAADLLRLLPKTGGRALDIGARGGRFARMLSQYYQSVTALDLIKPPYTIPGVETVAGNVTALEFADNSFDCVFCAEVLEHVPEIERGCAEIQRVARRDVLIGVPFR